MHNLHFYNELMARIRQALDEGTFEQFRAEYSGKLDRPIQEAEPDFRKLPKGLAKGQKTDILPKRISLTTGFGGTCTVNQGMQSIILLVVMFALIYFFMIRPENKRKKKAQEMRDSLKKGDTITTIGGIIGTICAVKENTIVIETGADRVRIEFTKWAVSTKGPRLPRPRSKDSVPCFRLLCPGAEMTGMTSTLPA